MDEDALAVLAERIAERTASADELAVLAAALRADAALARRLRGHVSLHLALCSALAPPPDAARLAALADQVRAAASTSRRNIIAGRVGDRIGIDLRANASSVRRPRPLRVRSSYVSVVAIVLVVAAAVGLARILRDTTVGSVDQRTIATGTWRLVAGTGACAVRGGDRVALALDAPLLAGDVVEAPTGATLRGPGADVILRARGALAISGADELALRAGGCLAEVVPHPADRPFRIASARGTATVVGTRFTLDLGDDAVRLGVEHGRVRLRDELGREVAVDAGSFAVAGGSAPPKASPLPAKPDAGSILLTADAARIVGGTWRVDVGAALPYGCALSASDATGPRDPAELRDDYVEFAFDAPAGVDYHVWVHGRSLAPAPDVDAFARDAAVRGAIALLPITGAWRSTCPVADVAALSGWSFDGFAAIDGSGWIGGCGRPGSSAADGVDGIRSSLRFAAAGRQILRLKLTGSPMLVDAILLAADAVERPEDAPFGPTRWRWSEPSRARADVGAYRTRGAQILRNGEPWCAGGVDDFDQWGLHDKTDAVRICRTVVASMRNCPIAAGEGLLQTRVGWLHPLEEVVGNNRAHGIVTILAMSGWDDGDAAEMHSLFPRSVPWYGDYRRRLAEIARHFSGQSDVWIDPWNEPYPPDGAGFTADGWSADMADLYDAIRAVNPDGIVLIPGQARDRWHDVLVSPQGIAYVAARTNVVAQLHATVEPDGWDPVDERARIRAIREAGWPLVFGSVYLPPGRDPGDAKAFLAVAVAERVPVLAWSWAASDGSGVWSTDTRSPTAWGEVFLPFLLRYPPALPR